MAMNGKNWANFGTAGGLGLGAGLIGSKMFGGSDYKNPANAGMSYLNQIPDVAKTYYNPSIIAGNTALPKIQEQFDQLTNDPGEMIKRFGSGYQQSPGFDWSMKQGQAAINNASAAGGMAGTPQHQQQAGEMATNLSNTDYYNYLNHVIGMYGQGLEGEKGLYDTGTKSSQSLADLLSNNLAGQAGYQYAGAAGENAANAQNKNNWYSGLGSIASLASLAL